MNIQKKTKFGITRLLAVAGVLLGSVFSCVTNYRTISTIKPDGSIFREIYARGDSAFLSGDPSKNPYLFQLDSGWQISVLNTDNSVGQDYNVKIGKLFHSPEEISRNLQFDEDYRPIVAPAETLQKHFRWFYTYYSYKAVYANIADKIPVSINDYLNVPEQKLWFQGDFSAYPDMNGMELKDEMDDIEKRFGKWHARNVYENRFKAILDFEKLSGGRYLSQMKEMEDTLFTVLFKDYDFIENIPETATLYNCLDKQLNTNYFYNTFKANRSVIDSLTMEKEKYLENMENKLFGNEIAYELLMPGKLLSANAPVHCQDTLIWKINAFRYLSDDYVLTAESRTANAWAFAVTFVLIALSIYYWIRSRNVKIPVFYPQPPKGGF
ncbi:hypothetical protein AGMMS50239_05320 [Bacteroidia bacterium]|nr:hypothetical protein AGMMS50239_05320 [Bacteroidia bacterium]